MNPQRLLPRPWVARVRSVGLLVAGLSACSESPRLPEPTLAEASQEVRFQSVDALGPHAYLATTIRTDVREGEVVSEVQEIFEIQWQGWDDFEMRRTVDGDMVSCVRVAEGRAWVLRNGAWLKRPDAEPYRQELRLSWSGWDQALGGYHERVGYSDAQDGVIEGRPARRYVVELTPPHGVTAPPPAAEAPAEGAPVEDAVSVSGPRSLSGFVWVDQLTAVRLVADVQGELVQDSLTRRTQLKLSRSAFGQDQGIVTPTVPEASPDLPLGTGAPPRKP